MEFISHSTIQTKNFAEKIVKEAAKEKRIGALCIALVGELGSGKTVFVNGVARAIGIERPMPSPTFVIMREVIIPSHRRLNFKIFYHFDWYRVERKKDVMLLGWDSIIRDPNNLVVVEWAEKFPSLIPSDAVWVRFKHRERGERTIIG